MLYEDLTQEYVAPGAVFGNIYFVGIRHASTHLIDTGEGLILIDPGYSETIHMIRQNIKELGFDEKDIRYILATHGHGDHMNAMAEMQRITGAKSLIGKKDLPLISGELYHARVTPFTPDILLSEGDTLTLGNTTIRFIETPGHTDGTLSFFFDVVEDGKTYLAGMFGGAGHNTLVKSFLTARNRDPICRVEFLASIERLKKIPVEIFLGNHGGNNNTRGKLKARAEGDRYAFLDPDGWQAFLAEREACVRDLMANDN